MPQRDEVAHVRGRVVDAQGQPVSALEVRVIDGALELDQQLGSTGGTGQFALLAFQAADEPDARTVELLISALPPIYEVFSNVVVPVTLQFTPFLDAPINVELPDIVLDAGPRVTLCATGVTHHAVISGRVFDAEGRPIPLTRVYLRFPDDRAGCYVESPDYTDAKGEYSIAVNRTAGAALPLDTITIAVVARRYPPLVPAIVQDSVVQQVRLVPNTQSQLRYRKDLRLR